jgi:hypothetical protein
MIGRMPVSGGEDGKAPADEPGKIAIQNRHDLIPAGNGQGSPGQKVSLDVHQEKSVPAIGQ